MDTLYFRITGVATTLDVELSMDNPWIHCINKLLWWLPHRMVDDPCMDNPWIIHGYIVFPNYWGGYYIGCRIIHG